MEAALASPSTGTGCPLSTRAATWPASASRAWIRAASTLFPQVKQPGSAGTVTLNGLSQQLCPTYTTVILTKEESPREALGGEAGASKGRSVERYALRRIGFAGDAAAGILRLRPQNDGGA